MELLLEPGDHCMTLRSTTIAPQYRGRSYWIHIPPEIKGPRTKIVFAFEGVRSILTDRSRVSNTHIMGELNGWNAASDSDGFIVVYSVAAAIGGLIYGWNTAHSLLTPDPGYDDICYVEGIIDDLPQTLGVPIGELFAVGFSQGGQFCNILAASESIHLSAIASVCGTVIKGQPLPRAGIRAVLFHGLCDEIMRYTGGSSSEDAQRARRMGHNRIDHSVPQEQLKGFLTANGLDRKQDLLGTITVKAFTLYTWGKRPVLFDTGEQSQASRLTRHLVSVYYVNCPWGGHSWPGSWADRKTDDADLAAGKCIVAPSTVLPCTLRIRQFFGLCKEVD